MFGDTPEAQQALKDVLGGLAGDLGGDFSAGSSKEGANLASAAASDASTIGGVQSLSDDSEIFSRNGPTDDDSYFRVYDDLIGFVDRDRQEGRRLRGWGAAVQAGSVGHDAEDVLLLHGVQDPGPEHVGRLDIQHPDHAEVIGPMPGVGHHLHKY